MGGLLSSSDKDRLMGMVDAAEGRRMDDDDAMVPLVGVGGCCLMDSLEPQDGTGGRPGTGERASFFAGCCLLWWLEEEPLPAYAQSLGCWIHREQCTC